VQRTTPPGMAFPLPTCTPPIAELSDRLRNCDTAEFEALCAALAQRLPQVAPLDAISLTEALVSALHKHLSAGNEQATAALLDEVCGSWASTKVLPHDTLRSLLRVLLRCLNRTCRAAEADGLQLQRSKSSPDIMRRPAARGNRLVATVPVASESGAARAEGTGSVAAEAALQGDGVQLPAEDLRLLQVILRLAGHPAAGEALGGLLVHPARPTGRGTRRWMGPEHGSEAERCPGAGAALGVALPAASPAALSTASPRRRLPQQDAPRVAEVHDMAAGDTSDTSGYQSEESIDWCCGAGPEARPADVPPAATSAQSTCASAHGVSQALCPQRRVPRCKSLPAGLRFQESEELQTLAKQDLQQHLPELRDPGGQILHDCLQSQDLLRGEYARMRQNQLLVLSAVQDTTHMLAAIQGAIQEERVARQDEQQERAALREDMHTVAAQMRLLAQGQLEMQRCLAALCARAPGAGDGRAVEQRPPAAPAPQDARRGTEQRPAACQPGTDPRRSSQRSSQRSLQRSSAVQTSVVGQQPAAGQRQMPRTSTVNRLPPQGTPLGAAAASVGPVGETGGSSFL